MRSLSIAEVVHRLEQLHEELLATFRGGSDLLVRRTLSGRVRICIGGWACVSRS